MMTCEVACTDWDQIEADWLIVAMTEDGPGPAVAALDTALGGQLERLRAAGDLTGKAGEIVKLPDVPAIRPQRLLIVGLGKAAQLDRRGFAKGIRAAVRAVTDKQLEHVAVDCPQAAVDRFGLEAAIASVATETVVAGVGQGLYQKEAKRFQPRRMTVLVESEAEVSQASEGLGRGHLVGEAVNLTRELVNRPAMEIFPASVADRVEQLGEEFGFEVEILEEDRIRAERMGALLAVSAGSERGPRVACLRWMGAEKPDMPTLALVGKGVTFDSGGYSLKPNDGMKDMKMDMAGAATVIGVVTAAARMKLPVNLIGYVGLVENLINGRAYKLGDVLTARNGTTIEVLNTDAEGRLVLADVLDFAIERGADHLVDLATLTGACMVALGEDVTGAFTNNEVWCNEVRAAAHAVGEHMWELPMHEHFAELLKSDVADCKNVGPRWGGAITAAKFLEKFVGETPWVHLDIAGPAFAASATPDREGGATGVMVRSLIELAAEYGTSRA